MATYQYTPISVLDEDGIRLLHLEPGTGDDIRFSLRLVRLSEKPSYEAISYCWGDPKDTHEVYCDGALLHVTNSLYTALKRLREEDGVRVLWADAVCINQTDTEEKNRQVRLMSAIYSQPTRVLVWLGDDTSGLDGLQECLKGAHEVLPPDLFEFDEIYPVSRKIFHEARQLRREGKPNFNDHDWRPIVKILCQPWFERRWIIQEVTLADDSVPRLAMCGDVEFSWNELASVAYRLTAYGITPLLAGVSTINHYAPYMLAFYRDGGKPMRMLGAACMTYLIKSYRRKGNLVDAVTATPYFKCTNSSDHLYSLLSLMEDSHGLEADYALPPEEVCRQFAVATLITNQNLRPLSLAPHTTILFGGQQPPRLDLPSWVPDLTCQGIVHPLVSYTIRPQLFHAGGDRKPNARTSADGKLLHLRGRVVDKVTRMARCQVDVPFPTEEEVLPLSGLHARVKKRTANWFEECREVAGEGYSKDDAEANRGFLETLMCGMALMRDPLPEELLLATQVYIDYLHDFFTEGYVLPEEVRETMLTYGALIEQSTMGIAESRAFCRTEQGRLGHVRAEAKEGDVFVCIVGAEVPYVLRPSSTREGVYTLIGDAFLLGVMQGETLSDARYETVDITIE